VRRPLTIALAALACGLPWADALAAKKPPKKHPVKKKAAPKKKPKPPPPTTTAATTTAPPPQPVVVVTSKDFTGPVAHAGDYGNIQVAVTVQKTTTTVGTVATVARKITDVRTPEVPGDTARSVAISQRAIPTLVRLTLQAQSADLPYLVTGATYTSRAFVESLQGALKLAQQA